MIEEGDEALVRPEEQLPVTHRLIVNRFGPEERVVEVLSVERCEKSAIAYVSVEETSFYVPLSRLESM